MNNLIREMSDEAHEILANIRACDELSWQQKSELMKLVQTDIEAKLELARNLLYDWTGNYDPNDKPLAG